MRHKTVLCRGETQPGQIIGWKLPAKVPPTGSVLIFHGNAGCAVDRDYLANPIHAAAPVNVFVLEYPGYGARTGSPSEKSFLSAAEGAFATLTNDGPIYVVGESLGTGVAAYMAKTHNRQFAGLVLFMPYNKLAATSSPLSRSRRCRCFLPGCCCGTVLIRRNG